LRLSIAHKLIILSVLLVAVTAGVVSQAFYSRTSEYLAEHALNDLSREVEVQGEVFHEHIDDQIKKLLITSNAPPIQGITRALQNEKHYDAIEGSNLQQWIQRLEKIFHATIAAEQDNLQLRLIDATGQEVLNVIRRNGQILTIPFAELQNKLERPYVQNTLKLPQGEIYLSEINLNQERGRIIEPWQEVLRVATPLFADEGGALIGMLVLNVEVGHALREIQEAVHTIGREIYITNDHGGYLLHPDKSKTYGFDRGKHYRAQEDVPQLAPFFLPDNSQSILLLKPEEVGSENVVVYTKVAFDPLRPQRFVAVGVSQSYSEIIAEQSGILHETFILSLGLLVPAIFLAILLSIRLAKPIRSITAVVRNFSNEQAVPVVLPVDRYDEIGTLARAFGEMASQVQEAQIALRKVNTELEERVVERTQALQESEAHQRAIVDNIVDGLITIDEKGIVQSVNPAVEIIFGFGPDEVIGSNIKMLMPEPYCNEHDGYLRNYLQTGEKKVIGIGREVEGVRKDGSTFPMELAVSEVNINDKKIFSGLVRDITERKRVEKLKNEFISTVSHELRTPLTSIRGSLGLISGGAVGDFPDKAKEMLKIASSNTERLLLLINDILDIQKIESGQMVFKFQPLDLMPFLDQALEEHAAYAEQHGVHFVMKKRLDGVRVYADKDRLMQVMANLLSNAAKFSPKKEVVEVSVAHLGESQLRISIADYGPGIPESFQSKLFERFTQSDSSDTRQKGGTGLGLSISKAIVEKHGGAIGFTTREGAGTTFYIDLPLQVMHKMYGELSQMEPEKRQRSVLIIEDDPDVAVLLKHMLAEEGFNGDIAHDTDEARKLLQLNPGHYKAITVDLLLPGQDGISFIDELRKDKVTRSVPVIVVSVMANEAKRDLSGGAISVADWLQKPIDQARLLDAIKQATTSGHIPRVLHVEDEADTHRVVSMMLQGLCELTWTTTLTASREALAEDEFDLVLLDIGLPDGSGLDLLDTIEHYVKPPRVVIFSAQEVSQEYADKVSAVLVKSHTDNLALAKIITNAIES